MRKLTKRSRMMTQDEKIEALKDLITLVQDNVNNNLNLVVSCLGICVAIAGAALYFIAKQLVESKVNKELKVIKKELEDKMFSMITNNPQIHWAKGVIMVPDNGILTIAGIVNINLDLPFRITLTPQKGNKDFKYSITTDGKMTVNIELENYNRIEDGNIL